MRLRLDAETIVDPEIKRQMLDAADARDRLAASLEAMRSGPPLPKL